MVEFAFNSGWRIGEIVRLRWQDVNLEKGLAWIVDPKNQENLEVPLNDAAIELIRRQERRSEYFFCHLNGKPFKTFLYGTMWAAFKRAGVELPQNKAWHIFRRTFAFMFLQAWGDVESLRAQRNWKGFSIPMWYANPTSIDQRLEIMNRFPKVNDRNMPETGEGVPITN
jgi:integrase